MKRSPRVPSVRSVTPTAQTRPIIRYPHRSPRTHRARAIVCAAIAVGSALALLGCNEGSTKGGNPLVGVWRVHGEDKRPAWLEFRKDYSYAIAWEDTRDAFCGQYQLEGNTVRLLDLFCGTGLPGVHQFSIADDTL
ncbi:MAG: hypothetical protein GF344_01380, partial [Chitinivibrionales bacterium]|nr:hypothetical protein [Chitinivibrionales bacterium]